jgi:hypothetical protein
MRELFFEYLSGMIEKGVTPDLAAELSAKLVGNFQPAPSAPAAKVGGKKRAPQARPADNELQTILDGVAWPLPWKDAIHKAAEAAGIKPGRASYKLMALVKQGHIKKNGANLYERIQPQAA